MGKKKRGVLIPVPPPKGELPSGYNSFLSKLKIVFTRKD